MAHSYYIYYRIDPAHSKTADARIRHLLDAVKDASGVAGRLLKKRGEPALWMEVYENVKDARKFEEKLAHAVGELKATEFLQSGGARHVECFED